MLNSTIVEVECVSKKRSKNVYQGNFKDHPNNHEIELSVTYNNNDIFYQMSGGTNLILRTVNDAAADMFQIGERYKIDISPVNSEVAVEA